MGFDIAEAFGGEELEVLGKEFGEEMGVARQGGEPEDNLFEEFIAVFAGFVEDMGREPGFALFGIEGVEGSVVFLPARGEPFECDGADVLVENDGAVFVVGAILSTGTGVVAVAELLDADGGWEHMVGIEAEAGMVVEVGALGELLEDGIELAWSGAVADFGPAGFKIGGWEQGSCEQD